MKCPACKQETQVGLCATPACERYLLKPPPAVPFPALARQAERERLLKDAKDYDRQAQRHEEASELKDARRKRKQASDCRLKARLIR